MSVNRALAAEGAPPAPDGLTHRVREPSIARLPQVVMARMPAARTPLVQSAPQADVDIGGRQSQPDFEFMNRRLGVTESTVLVVADSV